MGSSAKIGKCNVTENMELANKYGVSAVPTILVFQGGEVINRKVGALPKAQLQELLAVYSVNNFSAMKKQEAFRINSERLFHVVMVSSSCTGHVRLVHLVV